MEKYIKNCGQCPFFERFLEEYKSEIGKKVGKGICHKYKEDEVWETRTACGFVEQTPIDELEKRSVLSSTNETLYSLYSMSQRFKGFSPRELYMNQDVLNGTYCSQGKSWRSFY